MATGCGDRFAISHFFLHEVANKIIHPKTVYGFVVKLTPISYLQSRVAVNYNFHFALFIILKQQKKIKANIV